MLEVRPEALRHPHLPDAELKEIAPSYNKDFTTHMLDVMDCPSFINPWALPNVTATLPQGIPQPQPLTLSPRMSEGGFRPEEKEPRPPPNTKVNTKGAPYIVKSGVTSVVTSIGPFIS